MSSPKQKSPKRIVDVTLPVAEEMMTVTPASRGGGGKVKMTATIIAALSAVIVAVQFVFETKRWNNSPATYLVAFKDKFLDFCEWSGRMFAHLFSYLDWLEWRSVVDTINHLGTPLLEMCCFVFYFAKGYLVTAYEYNHPLSIFVGTLIPLVLLEEVLRRKSTVFQRLLCKYENLRGNTTSLLEWYVITGTFFILCFAVSFTIFYYSPLGYQFLFSNLPHDHPLNIIGLKK